MASVTLDRKGAWRAIVRDSEGRRRKLSTGVPRNQPKWVALRKALEIERRLLLDDDGGDPTHLATILSDLREAKVGRGLRPATIEVLDQKARRLLEHWGARCDVGKIRRRDVDRYVAQAQGFRSLSTLQKELSVLREAVYLSRRRGVALPDPGTWWPGDTLKGASKAKDRWLTRAEYASVLRCLPECWRVHMVVSVGLGLRRGELYALRSHHLDSGRREVTVPEETKTGTRRVPANKEAWAALMDLAAGGSASVLGSPGAVNRNPPLFTGTPNAWNMALRRAAEDAGIEHVSPNDLRRTFASWHAQAGTPEIVCSQMMGHKSSTMVRRVYAQVGTHAMRKYIDRLEGEK